MPFSQLLAKETDQASVAQVFDPTVDRRCSVFDDLTKTSHLICPLLRPFTFQTWQLSLCPRL